MSKIKIDKIKLADLSKDEQSKIMGGEQATPTTIVTIAVPGVIFGPILGYSEQCKTQNQLSCKLGTDSCGQCTTNYAC